MSIKVDGWSEGAGGNGGGEHEFKDDKYMLICVRAKTGASLDGIQFIFVDTGNGRYY